MADGLGPLNIMLLTEISTTVATSALNFSLLPLLFSTDLLGNRQELIACIPPLLQDSGITVVLHKQNANGGAGNATKSPAVWQVAPALMATVSCLSGTVRKTYPGPTFHDEHVNF